MYLFFKFEFINFLIFLLIFVLVCICSSIFPKEYDLFNFGGIITTSNKKLFDKMDGLTEFLILNYLVANTDREIIGVVLIGLLVAYLFIGVLTIMLAIMNRY